MKSFLLLAAATLIGSVVHAQVETVAWKGKTYYVYPHQQEMERTHYVFLQYAAFREVLKRDENNRKVIGSEVRPIEKHERYDYYYDQKQTKAQKQQVKFMREMLAKKPDLFYQYDYNTERDITPALTAIPDGEYIQYYRDLPYLDGTTLRFRNDVVAGVFNIRNNRLHGEATWFTANGMEMRKGTFDDGSRTGSWRFSSYTPKQDQSAINDLKYNYEKITKYLLNDQLQYDTTAEQTDYLNGVRQGNYTSQINGTVLVKGSFTNNLESGTWEYYGYKFRVENEMVAYTDSLTLLKRFTYAAPGNKLRGKGPIIRDQVIDPEFLYYDEYLYEESAAVSTKKDTALVLYNQYSYDSEFEDFGSFYVILDDSLPDEDGLELPEESVYSYEGEEMYLEDAYYYMQEYGGQYVNGKYYSRNQLIDSLGYRFLYEGVYESFYANGQLKMRFEVRDGQLQGEETVYWENGQPANTVTFDPESNVYEQRFYDYNGRLYTTRHYDAKGERIMSEADEKGVVLLDGVKYVRDYDYLPTMYYADREKLGKETLTERTLIEAGRWTRDSVLFMTNYLDPVNRSIERTEKNVMGDVTQTQVATFGEEYENANGVINTYLGNLRMETTANGSLYDFSNFPFMTPRNDSANPQVNALYWMGNYDLQSDEILYRNDQPFTGSFTLKSQGSSFRLSASESAINIQIPGTESMNKHMNKALRKFYKKGKRNPILAFYTSDYFYGSAGNMVYGMFPHTSFLFSLDTYDDRAYEGDYYDYDYEEKPGKKKKAVDYPYDKIITGNYLNGKPEGEWLVKDQFGNTSARMQFKKGDRNGEATFYNTEYPLTEYQQYERNQYIARYHTYIFEPAPEKKTHYLLRHETYVNGMLEGPAVVYSWKGDTLQYDEYHEGRQHGRSYQRNKIFYAVAGYEDGLIDGISRTYLTLPGRDSILIFDLNFQNGSLQGESRSYHTNGKLAKRGFFLSGQPIDDYEAFDTLGFRYQYVKFQYNQPIEEKIWEENELSARYLFDWKDSIPFYVQDIAASSSFESLAYDLGLVQNPYTEPYYGRPSLLDKTGINYAITKYYPNDTVARFGKIEKGKKVGYWKHFSYEGKPLYEINYFDTLLTINDSVKFKSKGVLTYLDATNRPLSKSYIIEKIEKYDCSHTDHTEERMLYAFWDADPAQQRINGYTKNYFDNGAIQNEGNVVNGLPTGTWKLYDSDGQLSQVGNYVNGKRHGRWLSGDLSNVKNMGEICLNPNLDNLEEIMAYQEKLLDVSVIYYHMGKIVKREYYGINLNNGDAPGDYQSEDMYWRE